MNVLTTAALDPAGSTAALDRLGDEIAELSVHLEAATARLLDLIREFDIRAGWNNGFRSCAHWLSWRVGLDLGAAREKVRVARALGTLPRLARALGRGELSYPKGRAVTRLGTTPTWERFPQKRPWSSSNRPTPWRCSPRRPCTAASIPAPPANAIRWWSTWMRPRSPIPRRPGNPCWKVASTFPGKRPGAWHATR